MTRQEFLSSGAGAALDKALATASATSWDVAACASDAVEISAKFAAEICVQHGFSAVTARQYAKVWTTVLPLRKKGSPPPDPAVFGACRYIVLLPSNAFKDERIRSSALNDALAGELSTDAAKAAYPRPAKPKKAAPEFRDVRFTMEQFERLCSSAALCGVAPTADGILALFGTVLPVKTAKTAKTA